MPRVITETAVPVLYLDLDGTVRQGKDDALGRFVNGPDDVRVFPEAVERMQDWKARGGRIVGISNQGGIALGIVTMAQVVASMIETQHQCRWLFDRIRFCQHFPSASDPEYARCWCRKPRAGMVIESAVDLGHQHPAEMYPPHLALLVGDRDEDAACAAAANIDFMWATQWRAGA